MSDSPTLVIPYQGKGSIPKGAAGSKVVMHTADPRIVSDIPAAVAEAGAELEIVWLRDQAKVTDIPFDPAWEGFPLLVNATEMGQVTELVPILPVIRRLSLRILLPTDKDENYICMRILASLGIHSGLRFIPDKADWENLLDLATYQYFALGSHGSVAPFDLIADRYVPGEGAQYGDLYFEDPAQFLHLDTEGKVAMSFMEIGTGPFLAGSIENLGEAAVQEMWEERKEAWRHFFLSPNRCASCPGWRLCRGSFEADLDACFPGCSEFFTELMDLVEDYQDSVGAGG